MAERKNTRATKNNYGSNKKVDFKTKKNIKKSLKSPIIIVFIICLTVGLVTGFFIGKAATKFEMNNLVFNGTEIYGDYLYIELNSIKEELESKDESGGNVSEEQIKNAIKIENEGVVIKFFGKDLSDTVKKEYFYREDMSHDEEKVDEIDYLKVGTYYVTYTSSHFAFKRYKLIRTIVITGAEIDG